MKNRTLVWTYVVIEALVLIPIIVYLACRK